MENNYEYPKGEFENEKYDKEEEMRRDTEDERKEDLEAKQKQNESN